MLKIALKIFLIILPVLVHAQNKDCKYEKFKDQVTGKPIQMITAPTKLGKLIVGKKNDSLVAYYSMKLIFSSAASTNNMIRLQIDSVQFVFDDYTLITFPASGSGTVKNQVVIKPQFEDINFGFVMSLAKVDYFLSKKVTGFKVYGQKEAQTFDGLNEKQSEKLAQTIRCFM